MDTFSKMPKIQLDETYQREIFGLGEVYEIISVERLRKKLLKRFGKGMLYLSSNKKHGGRGLDLDELKVFLSREHVLASGYTDCPPWPSFPREPESKRDYSPAVTRLAGIFFGGLARLEFLWQNPRRSHMIYCLTK